MRKLILLITLIVFCWCGTAFAEPLFFGSPLKYNKASNVYDFDGATIDDFIIDAVSGVTMEADSLIKDDIALYFGDDIDMHLEWDNSNGYLQLSDGSNDLWTVTDSGAYATFDFKAGLVNNLRMKNYVFIPVEWGLNGTTPPDAAVVVTSTNGKTVIRSFDDAQTEDLRIEWEVPPDIVAADGIKFWAVGVITNATGPTGVGMRWDLSGYSSGDNDTLTGTFGTAVESGVSGTYVQYDRWKTTKSGTVTVTNLAAEERVQFKLERDHDDAGDDYGQDCGLSGLWIEYTVELDS